MNSAPLDQLNWPNPPARYTVTDGALIEGFDPEVRFERTQTLMEGASHCDFKYRKKAG